MLSIRLNAPDFSRKTHIQLASHSLPAVHKPTEEERESNIKQNPKCSTSEKKTQAMPRKKYDYNQGMVEVKDPESPANGTVIVVRLRSSSDAICVPAYLPSQA